DADAVRDRRGRREALRDVAEQSVGDGLLIGLPILCVVIRVVRPLLYGKRARQDALVLHVDDELAAERLGVALHVERLIDGPERRRELHLSLRVRAIDDDGLALRLHDRVPPAYAELRLCRGRRPRVEDDPARLLLVVGSGSMGWSGWR